MFGANSQDLREECRRKEGGGEEKVKGEEISTEVRKWEKVTALDGEYNVPGENCS